MGFVAWTLVLLVLGVVSFVGWSLFGPDDDDAEQVEVGPVPPEEQTARPPEGTPDPPQNDTPPDPPDPTPPDTLPAVGEHALPIAYGREEEGIAPFPGVHVADGQGLLVLAPMPGGAVASVRVGERSQTLASGHIALPLPAGVHHLTYVRGDRRDFVWVAVRSGKTRYVPPLP
jgi:hypothetical protein